MLDFFLKIKYIDKKIIKKIIKKNNNIVIIPEDIEECLSLPL